MSKRCIDIGKYLVLPVINKKWDGGPFKNLPYYHAKQFGSIGEKIVETILSALNYDVARPNSTQYDRIINDRKTEFKCSRINGMSDDRFSFLQIRPEQTYDDLLLCTFWFDGMVKIYKLSKTDIKEFIKLGIFKKQHEGKKGKGSTYSYNGNMDLFAKFFYESAPVQGNEKDGYYISI